MRRNEIIGLSAAVAVFATVLASLILETVINTAQAIESTVLFVLVCVTAIYTKRAAETADAAKQQADASVKMAKEMRNARSPFITMQWGTADRNNKKISVNLENEGFGPALNLTCYLTHKELDFNYKSCVYTTFKVGQTYQLSLPSENFDFKAWNGLSINCDYGSILGNKFRSILRCKSEENRSLEIIKLNSEHNSD